MIPATSTFLQNTLTTQTLPERTFKLDPDTLTVSATKIDGREAIKQAIYLILGVARYKWLIHSWDYGAELTPLIGKDPDYCCAEIERLVREALTQDDRITDVQSFEFETAKNKILVSFTAVTIYGDIDAETEVDI